MPFEPRLIPDVTDEPLGSLPDDLAALGQQLADDADWLAERYAPGESAAMPTAGEIGLKSRWSAPVKVMSAAIVLLAFGILSVNAWRAWDGRPRGISSIRSNGISQGTAAVLGARTNASRPPETPVVSFEDLSTSQQEAVLDLWEFHQADAPSLSI